MATTEVVKLAETFRFLQCPNPHKWNCSLANPPHRLTQPPQQDVLHKFVQRQLPVIPRLARQSPLRAIVMSKQAIQNLARPLLLATYQVIAAKGTSEATVARNLPQ